MPNIWCNWELWVSHGLNYPEFSYPDFRSHLLKSVVTLFRASHSILGVHTPRWCLKTLRCKGNQARSTG